VAIADDDGAVWRLYKPTRANPSILRLASLSDEYGNALLTEWDEHGRLVGLHDEPRAIDVTLRYEDERFPQRVTAASHFDGNHLAADAVALRCARPAGERDGCLRRGDA
jgi:hypothetical protein